MEDIFNVDDSTNLIDQLSSDTDVVRIYKELKDRLVYHDEGYHVQVGIQGRVFMTSLFINLRYTLIEDVYGDSPGFTSVWCGLAFSF